jgi:hypothetical protein
LDADELSNLRDGFLEHGAFDHFDDDYLIYTAQGGFLDLAIAA